jgi:hypothetical protein
MNTNLIKRSKFLSLVLRHAPETIHLDEDFMTENIEFRGNLDGTWCSGSFKLIIKGNTYVSRYNRLLYGKGTIVYDNENFILTSTHARGMFFLWIPFVERVKGKYIGSNEKLTVSNMEGRYSDLNGIWRNIKYKKQKINS